MNAEQYLNEALGGNMNIGTLKPLAWHGIMEGYARQKRAEATDNNAIPCKEFLPGSKMCPLGFALTCGERSCLISAQH